MISCRTPPGGGGVSSDLKIISDFGHFLKIISEKEILGNCLKILMVESAAGAKNMVLKASQTKFLNSKPPFSAPATHRIFIL